MNKETSAYLAKLEAVAEAALRREKAIQKGRDVTHDNEREMVAKELRETEKALSNALRALKGGETNES